MEHCRNVRAKKRAFAFLHRRPNHAAPICLTFLPYHLSEVNERTEPER